MQHTYYPPLWLGEKTVKVVLVGAGGTGSEALDVLARIHHGLLGVGHPGGLAVTLIDGDEVSEANVGRQRYSYHDIGLKKSDVLIHRYNLFYGLTWSSIPAYLDNDNIAIVVDDVDILITCVDKANVRCKIAEYCDYDDDLIWIDHGNSQFKATVILGNACQNVSATPLRLPHVVDLFPEMYHVNDDDAPSCSMAEALRQQDLMVNRTVADIGGMLLWKLLREGQLTMHGAMIDTQSLSVQPIKIDDAVWEFYGYSSSSRKTERHSDRAITAL